MDAKVDVDVIIVGAGISGIGAACHLRRNSPQTSFLLIEARERLGGTWDLFRYPGIRSDSDMFTLGYNFKPWMQGKAIAAGQQIQDYLEDAARDHDVLERIQLGMKVRSASWDSNLGHWTVVLENTATGETQRLRSTFLFMGSGYYNYEKGYTPEFPGSDSFGGQIIHPQHWPEDLDYEGKKVVVIGSGATAITLIPSLAEKAAHVTMLQRSPTYVGAAPNEPTGFRKKLRKYSPALAYRYERLYRILLNVFGFKLIRRFPEKAKAMMIKHVKAMLGEEYDVETHFNPDYAPWDQRVCLDPDAQMFVAIRNGTASVETDHIETFTHRGIRLKSGKELEADIIVTATGLDVRLFGGVAMSCDGREINPANHTAYRSMMLSNVPNMIMCFGYTNASWTLKTDLTCEYFCRLINHMDKKGYGSATPRLSEKDMETEAFLDMKSGYVTRALDRLPKRGKTGPWQVEQNYLFDRWLIGRGKLEDGVMEFSGAPQPQTDRQLELSGEPVTAK